MPVFICPHGPLENPKVRHCPDCHGLTEAEGRIEAGRRVLDGVAVREKTPEELFQPPPTPTPADIRRERIAALLAQDDATADLAPGIAARVAGKPNLEVRAALYRALADKWLIAFLAYRELGQTAKADAAKAEYLKARQAIADEFKD